MPGNAWSHQKLEEARNEPLLKSSGQCGPAHTLISLLASRTVREHISVVLSQTIWGTSLWQPREMNANSKGFNSKGRSLKICKRSSIWTMTYLLPFGIGVFQVLVAPQTTLSFNSLLRGITEFSKAIVVMVMVFIGLPTWLSGKKKSACDVGSTLGQEDLLEKEMATPCSILAWKIPWIEEPGGLWGWQIFGQDLTKQQQ